MYSPEVHYLVRKEIYQDRQRDVARHQLIQSVRLRQLENGYKLRRIIGGIGAQMVMWGSKLQRLEQGQQQTLTQQRL